MSLLKAQELVEAQHTVTEVIISSDLAEGKAVMDQILAKLSEHPFGKKEIFGINLALDEAVVNAIKHGNKNDKNKKVHIRFRISAERFDITITDEGLGFDPDAVPDCLDAEGLGRPSGRGLFLIRENMTEVIVRPPGNSITMYKIRGQEQPTIPPAPANPAAVDYHIDVLQDRTQATVETTFGQ